ncbi:SDR family oxidoreductase [uncultured Lacinutrix sp.]|uniref:SDR family oxidoreductase n=1 Tax=uncultured Lacinutrix sp. TaxID=574032 RepID=UPI0026360A40|nr:SDR family oxidoreductase [uncultured Lacinutrix sp.]
MNCLLTGGTGIVGSHIIFDWLKKAFIDKTVNHLFVLIRDNETTAQERLLSILKAPSRPEYLNAFSIEDCLKKITVITGDLISVSKTILNKYDFDTVIHCAGSTNLSNANKTEDKVQEQNVKATKQLLTNLPKQVNRFLYISTAYSFGIQEHKVKDTIAEYDVSSFRNPYEKSKFEAEQFVKKTCENLNISAQILRPSIICGRLIDAPFYETPKFDVFYSWPIFLDKYAKKFKDVFRIWIDKDSGLNIVPVDFVSKAILYAAEHPEIKELNIVNPKQILHKEYVGNVLESFAIKDYQYITKKPSNLNSFEQLYYKTIGSVFEKYVSIPDLQFDAQLILKLINQLKLDTTLGVHDNFMNLINFSVEKKFRKSY